MATKHILFCILLYLLVSFTQCSKPNLPQVGQQAPEFTLNNLNGEKIRFPDPARKGMLLVNFMATWCLPCKEEVARLNQIHQKYKQKGITVVGVSAEDPAIAVISFMKKHKVQYSMLLDSNGRAARRYGLIDFPANVLIDKQGKILFLKPGMIDENAIAALVKRNADE